MSTLRKITRMIEPQNVIGGASIQLVEKMLVLRKECQSVRREDDLDRVRNLERQIAQVDEQIDQRVYALYGLSPEEIRIVEGNQ